MNFIEAVRWSSENNGASINRGPKETGNLPISARPGDLLTRPGSDYPVKISTDDVLASDWEAA